MQASSNTELVLSNMKLEWIMKESEMFLLKSHFYNLLYLNTNS
jgi:hypothetical protein